jgi:hypothetical protein
MKAPPRSMILALLALVLMGAVVWRWRQAPETPARSAVDIGARVANLRRVAAAEDAINTTYAEQGYAYAQAMVALATMKRKGEPDRAFVERLLRARFDGTIAPDELTLQTGEAQPLGDGVTRVPVDLTFTAHSDRQALDTLVALGLPETGFAWDEFSMLSDPHARKITVSGRLNALVVEAVE